MKGGRTLPSMLGKNIFELSCCYEHYGLSVRQEESAEMEFPCCYEHCWVSVRQEDNYWDWRTLLRRSFQFLPHGFMARLGGESGKKFWLPCSTVGRNVVVPFVFPQTNLDMLILFLLYLNIIYISVVMHFLILSWSIFQFTGKQLDPWCSISISIEFDIIYGKEPVRVYGV